MVTKDVFGLETPARYFARTAPNREPGPVAAALLPGCGASSPLKSLGQAPSRPNVPGPAVQPILQPTGMEMGTPPA